MNVKVGDNLLRVMPPDHIWDAFILKAEVIKVDDKLITCLVIVDVPRTMHFHKKNGMSTDGESFLIRAQGKQ